MSFRRPITVIICMQTQNHAIIQTCSDTSCQLSLGGQWDSKVILHTVRHVTGL